VHLPDGKAGSWHKTDSRQIKNLFIIKIRNAFVFIHLKEFNKFTGTKIAHP